jgi:hypothetical protein
VDGGNAFFFFFFYFVRNSVESPGEEKMQPWGLGTGDLVSYARVVTHGLVVASGELALW